MTEAEYTLENNAHKLIVKLCEAKNIKLDLRQEGRTGHCEIPEIWTLEKPMQITETEFDEIIANPSLNFNKEIGADGQVFITEFRRGGGWVVYEIDQHDDSRYFNG